MKILKLAFANCLPWILRLYYDYLLQPQLLVQQVLFFLSSYKEWREENQNQLEANQTYFLLDYSLVYFTLQFLCPDLPQKLLQKVFYYGYKVPPLAK